MYPRRVVSDQSQVSSEGPWEKLLENGEDLSATAGPVVNGESSTFRNEVSSNEKFGESYEQLSPEDSEDAESEYSGIGISKDEDKNITDLIPPTADAVSHTVNLNHHICIHYNLLTVILVVLFGIKVKL